MFKLSTICSALLPLLLAAPALAQGEPPTADDPAAPPATDAPPVTDAPQAEDSSEEVAAELHRRAETALAAGDFDEACGLFRQSDEKAPNDDTKLTLGRCLERAGRDAAALAVYEAVASAGGSGAALAKEKLVALRGEEEPPPEPAAAAETTAAAERTDDVAPAAKKAESKSEREGGNRFSDFMDTRLTWTFGDDDLLHATGETVPLSPNVSIGDRKRYRLFFDNLNSAFGGRENLTHLVVYKKMPGFIDNLDTEASLVLRFDLASLASGSNNLGASLYDAGSFLRLFYHLGADAQDDKTGVGLTLFPIDTDRFRLGYLYDISWGGTNARSNQSIFPRIQGSSPGAKMQFDHPIFYAFAGMKTAQIVQVSEITTPGTSEVEVVRTAETNYGLLAGGGAKIGDYLHADAGGGYFQQGKFDLPDVFGEDVYTVGVSGRLAVHDKGSEPTKSADFALYRNDPMKHDILLAPSSYDPGRTRWTVSGEYVNLWQNLKDFDVSGNTKLQSARAAALQGTMKTGFFRVSLTGIYRDLPFVLRNVPGFVPFETLPESDSVKTGDEFFVAAASDYHFDGPRLTPGIGAGLQFPATFETNAVDAGGNTIGRTVVVRQQGNLSILPVDRSVVPVFQARASLKWEASSMLSAVMWVQYVRDNNGTFVERDPNEGTVALRSFTTPDFLGIGGSAQARF